MPDGSAVRTWPAMVAVPAGWTVSVVEPDARNPHPRSALTRSTTPGSLPPASRAVAKPSTSSSSVIAGRSTKCAIASLAITRTRAIWRRRPSSGPGGGLKNFKGQAALSTWLYRIAVNACLNRVAARKPDAEPLQPDQFVDTQTEDPRAGLLRVERAAAVRRAISELPGQAARDADSSHLSRAFAPADRRHPGQFGRGGEGEFLPRLANLKKILGREP